MREPQPTYQMKGYLHLFSVDITMDHYSFALVDILAVENPYNTFEDTPSYY